MKKKPIKKVGQYECMEVVGRGNYAQVYLSIDTKNKQLVAIKCIPKSKIDKEDQVNLNRELEILHRMKHPNIVGIKNHIENKNNHYIVLEYCNGSNLENYLKQYKTNNNHPLNELYIQKIMQQIAPALEYMHSNNIIHRDIKLQNILINFNSYPNITKDGLLPPKLKFNDMSLNKSFSIKIADLGFAKDLVKDSEGSTILGSPLYMSPDIVLKHIDNNNKKYNTAVDLWSLGIITYELLTGSTPFLGTNADEVFNSIKKGVYTLPKKLRPSIEIISFINGLLQYYPEKRLNWKQINSHPFLINNVNEFTYIDLEMVNEDDKGKIEINSKDSDNLLWVFFKSKNLNISIDKLNQKEAKKPEIKKEIDKNKVINEEVQKALEKERIELEKEKQKIKEMKEQAEQEKKKAEQEKINRKKEQEKLVNEEKDIKNMKEKLIKESEKNKTNSEEHNKKLKELELQLEKIKKDKNNVDDKLKDIEQKITETEKLKKYTEKQINLMNKDDADDKNNEQHKKDLDKLIEEKTAMEKEMKKLKENQKLKEDGYKKENDNLQKKMKEISDQKQNLEKEVHENNNIIQEKLKNTDEQMKNLELEMKKIEEEKEKQIKNIQSEKDNLEKQIVEYSKIIKKREDEEKEREKKGIFMSCIEINKEDVEKQEKEEKESHKDEKEEDKKIKEKEDDDEWEEIDNVDSEHEDNEIDIEDYLLDDYEIVENYVDNEMIKMQEMNKNN